MFNSVILCDWSFQTTFYIYKIRRQNHEKTSKRKYNDNFDLSLEGIRELLSLNKPIYEITSSYGHFGRKPSNKGEFSWEKTDKFHFLKVVILKKNLNFLY